MTPTETHKRYSHTDMHWMLISRSDGDEAEPQRQAYACPYYVRLKGVLGDDWGVIVNPLSRQFGKLVFEHHDCGCVGGCPRGDQKKDEWLLKDR